MLSIPGGPVRNQGESRPHPAGAGQDDKERAMRLTVTTFVTMDGVMQSPGAPQEDPRGGFDLGGWLPPLFDEDTGQYMNEVFDKADAILLGRRTYEAMAGFWPSVTDPANRVGVALNSLPKHVVTSTLTELSWANSVPVRGDIAQHVAELKKAPGRELQVHGSAALVHFLTGHSLVDGYNLVIFPVVLGRGTRLFADGTPPATMRLTGTRSTGNSVVMHGYETAGAPAFGQVHPDEVSGAEA
jgi:dihydrofolate reductase